MTVQHQVCSRFLELTIDTSAIEFGVSSFSYFRLHKFYSCAHQSSRPREEVITKLVMNSKLNSSIIKLISKHIRQLYTVLYLAKLFHAISNTKLYQTAQYHLIQRLDCLSCKQCFYKEKVKYHNLMKLVELLRATILSTGEEKLQKTQFARRSKSWSSRCAFSFKS